MLYLKIKYFSGVRIIGLQLIGLILVVWWNPTKHWSVKSRNQLSHVLRTIWQWSIFVKHMIYMMYFNVQQLVTAQKTCQSGWKCYSVPMVISIIRHKV